MPDLLNPSAGGGREGEGENGKRGAQRAGVRGKVMLALGNPISSDELEFLLKTITEHPEFKTLGDASCAL